jgi:hypothetical protein
MADTDMAEGIDHTLRGQNLIGHNDFAQSIDQT